MVSGRVAGTRSGRGDAAERLFASSRTRRVSGTMGVVTAASAVSRREQRIEFHGEAALGLTVSRLPEWCV